MFQYHPLSAAMLRVAKGVGGGGLVRQARYGEFFLFRGEKG